MAYLLTWCTIFISIFFSSGQCIYVERGTHTNVECVFYTNATSVTWMVHASIYTRNVTTCSFWTTYCNNREIDSYQGNVTDLDGRNVARLNVYNRAIYSFVTNVICIGDNGQTATTILNIYVSPSQPICDHQLKNTSLDIRCMTTNVYPNAYAKLHRREADLTSDDIGPNYPQCQLDNFGSLGDKKVTCLWSFPVSKMRTVNTFYVEMTVVEDASLVKQTTAVSEDFVVSFSVPQVAIYKRNCPIGPGVRGEAILIGTNATCTCDLSSPGFPPGFARWYNKHQSVIGREKQDGSSTITVSYNPSDSDQAYECRPFTPLIADLGAITYTPVFTSCFVPAKQGENMKLQYPFPKTTRSVTWQLLGGDAPVNLTTCSFLDNNCSKSTSPLYSGYISRSDNNTDIVGLNITSVRTNETRFAYLTDNGQRVDTCMLDVYSCPVVVEMGHPANLQCSFSSDVTSVTWQLLGSTGNINLTTCNFTDNKCSDLTPALYQGFLTGSSETKGTSLYIQNTKIGDTQFICLANTGQKQHPCPLQVYAWPMAPYCRESMTNTYAEIYCTTNTVYPGINAVIHRRGVDLTNADLEAGYPNCITYTEGNISDGTYSVRCTWRIPVKNMLISNELYVEMSSNITDESLNDRKPVVSNSLPFTLSVPVVGIDSSKCPVGPGVVGESIRIGTQATCSCKIETPGYPPGYAQWYTQDNELVGTLEQDRSSSLTVSYNSSDLNQVFECRPHIAISANVSAVKYTPKFTTCLVAAEWGHFANLRCPLSGNLTNVTWQLLGGPNPVNLTTCNFVNRSCTAWKSTQYIGYLSGYGDDKTTWLSIASAQMNETKFICLADNGQRGDPCMLEVYRPPNYPICTQSISSDYVEYTCTAYNIYPEINAVLHRRQVDLTEADFVPGYPKCIVSQGVNYRNSESCTWRIPFDRMSLSGIYVEMTAKVSDSNIARLTAARSLDLWPTLSVPQVIIYYNKCPVGTGVSGQVINTKYYATCTCDLLLKGTPPGRVRWYDQNNNSLGFEDPIDGSSSTISIFFNVSDPHQSYVCRPVTVLKANVVGVTYTPVFWGSGLSGSSSAITGLHWLVVAIGALCAGIVSRLD